MSLAGGLLFIGCALVALLSAIGTVLVKSPIRAAMSLLVHIIALSGLFLTLNAHLLAALQLLVYAGAVVVLFVFVIMMIGAGVKDTPTTRGVVGRTAAIALMTLVTGALGAAVSAVAPAQVAVDACGAGTDPDCTAFGSVVAFSRELYLQDFAPFELISVLLTVAIVGAIAVARGRNVGSRQSKPTQTGAELARAGGE